MGGWAYRRTAPTDLAQIWATQARPPKEGKCPLPPPVLFLRITGAFTTSSTLLGPSAPQTSTGCVVSSRPRTTRRAPHIYPDISGDGFQYHSSQLTFSDEWYCPQTMRPEDVGSTPGLSHSHRRVLTGCVASPPGVCCLCSGAGMWLLVCSCVTL